MKFEKELKKVLDSYKVYIESKTQLKQCKWKLIKILHSYLKDYDYDSISCNIVTGDLDFDDHIEIEVHFKDYSEVEKVKEQLKFFKNGQEWGDGLSTITLIVSKQYIEKLFK